MGVRFPGVQRPSGGSVDEKFRVVFSRQNENPISSSKLHAFHSNVFISGHTDWN